MPIYRRRGRFARRYGRRPFLRKRTKFIPRVRKYDFGQRRIKVFQNTGLAMAPNGASRYFAEQITDISRGETIEQRDCDRIYSKSVFIRMLATNTASTTRYLRLAVVTLSGSFNSADTTTWTDILINSTYTKTGPLGLADDVLFRINRDEYKVIADRFWRISASADGGPPPTLEVNFAVKTRKLVAYQYNSDNERRTPIWVVWWVCEREGTVAGASAVNLCYSMSHYFSEVNKILGSRGGKRVVRSIRKGA